MSGDFRQRIGERYIAFARKWMNYVLTKCESGRGTRPRYVCPLGPRDLAPAGCL